MSINNDLYKNIDFYQKEFEELGVVTIPNFLDYYNSTIFYNYLSSYNRWRCLIYPNKDYKISYIEKDSENFDALVNFVSNRNEFSYYYQRCDELMLFDGILLSEAFIDLTSFITHLKIKSIITMFATKYERNCFINKYTEKGKLGFEYNLTKEWNQNDNGNLEIYSKLNNKRLVKEIEPKFNSITIFSLDKNCSSIKVIPDNCKNNRLSIFGYLG